MARHNPQPSPRWAIVTGASSGIGKEIVLAFARMGVNVVLSGRNAGRLKAVAERCSARNVMVKSIQGNLQQPAVLARLQAECRKLAGVDFLVHSAGVYDHRSISNLTANEYGEIIDTNLMIPIKLTQLLLRQLRQNSKVIFLNSLSGLVGYSDEGAYSVSKRGLAAFADSIQKELTLIGASAMTIFLGATRTRMTSNRGNREKFIDSSELAKVIIELSVSRNTLRIKQLEILRQLY